jgi:hypothetical protein
MRREINREENYQILPNPRPMIELNKRSQRAGSHLMSDKKNSARQFLSHRVSLAAPAAITILDVRAGHSAGQLPRCENT